MASPGWSLNGNQLTTSDNVGVGTATPASTLDVGGGLLHVGGTTTPTTTLQGAYLGWNALTGGTGETDFINNQGSGSGGFAFMNTPASGSPRTTLMFITGSGNVGVGTTSPQKPLDVTASGGIRIGQTAQAANTNEIYFADNGQIRSLDDNHRIIFNRSVNDLELREYGTITLSPGATQGQRTAGVVVNTGGGLSANALNSEGNLSVGGTCYFSGNVGINLSQQDIQLNNQPSSPLVVMGNANISGNVNVSAGLPNTGNVNCVNVTATGNVSCVNVTASGDVVLTGADCAEHFDVSGEPPGPGAVVVIDEEGVLRESRDAYDKKVAGVVSGAGDYRPALVLDKRSSDEGRIPVALMGKVYCKVDARYSPIEVGDLLTTSRTPGHAMKAAESERAFGAVIGKALRPFGEGQGIIPILIALQ